MTSADPPRFRFGAFILSPRRRQLFCNGEPVALIPKYFDLLHLLVRRRHDAVSKATIFGEVWSDVIVTDGALSQAVRTIRRVLGDDSKEARFIRTVPRHGYQFIHANVVEEPDVDTPLTARGPDAPPPSGAPASAPPSDTLDAIVARLLQSTATLGPTSDEARDAAEVLHGLDTRHAVAKLQEAPNHAPAIAVLRDARWSVPGAGDVPLVGDTEAPAAVAALVRLRLSGARRALSTRWGGASGCSAGAGATAGFVGGLLLNANAAGARPGASVALAAIGALAGGLGGAGIGAGVVAAEVLARAWRGSALVAGGAAGGGLVASAALIVLDAVLGGLFGLGLTWTPGLLAGAVVGGAIGGGYGWATRQPPGGGLAAPSGWRRARVVAVVSACAALATAGLALAGHHLVGGLVHEIATHSLNARLVLAPLGQLIGEPDFGPTTRTLLAAFEGAVFGAALAWGLTRRPRTS